MGHFILGLIILIIGIIITIKSEWLLRNLGAIGFFEQHLATSGGSRLGYKLIGITVAVIGILIMTNLITATITWILKPLMRSASPEF